MENELEVLSNIEKNKNATQRDIARNTGMSLGNVNALIKRLVKKGLLNIEKLNPKTIRYILTPKGMREKAEATYNYIVVSYRFINDINSKIDELVRYYMFSDGNYILLFGEQDEVCELLKNKLAQACIHHISVGSLEQLLSLGLVTASIVVWHPNFADILEAENIGCINLLDRL